MGNRESGTGNWFLVPYLSKHEGYFKTVDREQGIGNREPAPCSLFWYIILMFQKWKSGIRSQFPVPFFYYNWVDTSFWFCLFHQHVRHLMILKSSCYLSAYDEYCDVNVEEAYIIRKMRIESRESGTGSLFLI